MSKIRLVYFCWYVHLLWTSAVGRQYMGKTYRQTDMHRIRRIFHSFAFPSQLLHNSTTGSHPLRTPFHASLNWCKSFPGCESTGWHQTNQPPSISHCTTPVFPIWDLWKLWWPVLPDHTINTSVLFPAAAPHLKFRHDADIRTAACNKYLSFFRANQARLWASFMCQLQGRVCGKVFKLREYGKISN